MIFVTGLYIYFAGTDNIQGFCDGTYYSWNLKHWSFAIEVQSP